MKTNITKVLEDFDLLFAPTTDKEIFIKKHKAKKLFIRNAFENMLKEIPTDLEHPEELLEDYDIGKYDKTIEIKQIINKLKK